MWSSIKNAIKIICNDRYTASEKVFEVAKVMTAGLVGVIGFSLNELIEKGLMSLGVPFASFIAECLSGLFSRVFIEICQVTLDSLKFYKKLDEHIGLALSPVTTTKLDGSIKTCEDLQIPSSDICCSTKDVDAIINMFKK